MNRRFEVNVHFHSKEIQFWANADTRVSRSDNSFDLRLLRRMFVPVPETVLYSTEPLTCARLADIEFSIKFEKSLAPKEQIFR